MSNSNDRKNSFVMYFDQQSTFEALSDEEAGKIIKGIFKYVQKQEFDNKFNGERVLEMTFLPIKNTLDRDEIKYEERCKKNSENAKKRWEMEKIDATAYE